MMKTIQIAPLITILSPEKIEAVEQAICFTLGMDPLPHVSRRTRSPRVLTALGMRPLGSKHQVDLQTPQRAQLLDDLLAERGLSLEALCNGLVDGRVAVSYNLELSTPA